MSRNCACKFLYGPETSHEDIATLENALETLTELKIEIKFYTKTGELNARYFKYIYSHMPIMSFSFRK